MKRYLSIILIIVFALTLSACGKKEEVKVPDDEVTLEGITYKLDQEDTGYNLKYKIASNFRRSDMINAINYYSEKINGSSYFVIRIYEYKGKDIEYAINDSVDKDLIESREEVEVGNDKFTKVHFKNSIGDAETDLFYKTHNNVTYTFVFTAGIDLSRLETIFLTNIEYPEDRY